MLKVPLSPWQEDASTKLLNLRRYLLAADTGTGKTRVALKMIETLKNEGRWFIMVMGPSAAMITWQDALREQTTFTYSVDDFDPNVDVNLVSNTKLDKILPKLQWITPNHNAALFIDEAHSMKSSDSQFAFKMRGGVVQNENVLFRVEGFLSKFQLAYGITACPTGEILIPTRAGVKRAKDLRKGDVVFYNGMDCRVEKNELNPKERVIRIETGDGYFVEGNLNHPVRTKDGWKFLRDVVLGDKVELCFNDREWQGKIPKRLKRVSSVCGKGRRTSQNEVNCFSIRDEEDLAKVLGWLVGDGWISKDESYTGFVFGPKDKELEDEILGIIRKWGFAYSRRERGTWSEVTVGSVQLASFLIKLGMKHGAKNKNIPEVVWKSSSALQRVFLKYLFLADGNLTVVKDYRLIRLATESAVLAREVQIMLGMLGIKSFSRIGSKRRKTECSVIVSQEHANKFLREIKVFKCCALGSGRDLTVDFFFSGVVKKEEREDHTHAITVKGGVYNSNCLVSHNTPMVNHIEDLYWMVEGFFPGFFPSLEWFLEQYTVRLERKTREGRKYKEIVDYKNLDQLEEITKQIMYRHSGSYNVNFFTELCDLTEDEWSKYVAAGQGYLREVDRNFVSRLPDLQRIVNGAITYEGEFNRSQQLSSKEKKLAEVLNMIRARGEGAVVFTECLYSLRRFNLLKPITNFENYYFMEGATAKSKRAEIRRSLSPAEVLFSSKVGGTSMNLQAVNNVVFFDMPWSVGDILQNIGRVTRVDSTYDHQNVYFICAKGTIDQYKTALVSANMALLKKVIGGYGFMETCFKRVQRQTVIELRRSLLWGRK